MLIFPHDRFSWSLESGSLGLHLSTLMNLYQTSRITSIRTHSLSFHIVFPIIQSLLIHRHNEWSSLKPSSTLVRYYHFNFPGSEQQISSPRNILGSHDLSAASTALAKTAGIQPDLSSVDQTL